MDPEIKNRFTDNLRGEVLARFEIDPAHMQILDGFESFIYEFQKDGAPFILRVSHSERRPRGLIQAEVDWIAYLAQGGAGVSQPVLSQSGRLMEPFPDGHGGEFLATAFEKAAGGPPGSEIWDDKFYEIYGQTLGKIHALSKAYTPDPTAQRPHWDDPIMLDNNHIPPEETTIHARFQAVLDHLAGLSRDPEGYGLIHFDAHGGNFFVDEDLLITLFDFDDCNYSWYINDIAIVLFYTAMWEKDPGTFTRRFLTHFLRGYLRETTLDPVWLQEIPWMLKLRELDLYGVIHRSFDLENLDDPWVAGYMKGRKTRIEQDQPYIDFDFDTLR